jgi:hypothetical protein
MTWLSQLSWWQLTLIVIAVVWIGTFIVQFNGYWSMSQQGSGILTLLIFFLIHPLCIFDDLKFHLFTKNEPLEFGQFKSNRSVGGDSRLEE